MAKTFELLNKCLGEYYESLGNNTYYQDDDKIGKFLAFCEKDAYDEDDMKEEIYDNDADNCAYIDMDDDFPFPNNVDTTCTNENILKELKFCYENGYPSTRNNNKHTQDKPNSKPIQSHNNSKHNESLNDNTYEQKSQPACGYKTNNKHKTFKQFGPFNINKNDKSYKPTKKLYLSETFVTQTKGHMASTDETMLKWLAIGYKNHDLTFLMNLSGACVRDYLFESVVSKKNEDNIDATKWVKQKSALRKCLSKKEQDELGMALNAYNYRTCPPYTGTELMVIKDSILDISVYIPMMTQFIHSVIIKKHKFTLDGAATMPCQIDMVIAVQGTHNNGDPMMPIFDEDDDDLVPYDDDKENTKEETFGIGDLRQKLRHNHLIHHHTTLSNAVLAEVRTLFTDPVDEKNVPIDTVTVNMQRCFGSSYVDFRKNLISTKYPKDGASYPRGKRLCVFIDRSKLEENGRETITFYDPPDGTNAFPTKGRYPAEWYFKLSKDCLIPEVSHQELQDGELVKVVDEKRIGSQTGLEGQIMTFQFHIEQKDEIRCYLHWSGKCFRFYPKDIIDLLPFMFDEGFEGNKNWSKSKEAKLIAQSVEIRDVRFEKFYESLDKRSKSPH